MINNKWYKVSLFIPFWGTVINCLLLYIQLLKNKFKAFTLFKLMFLSCVPSGLLFILGQLLSFEIYGSEATWITFLSFILSGYLMNIIFKLIYEKDLRKEN
jgi:hypothetical protein